MVRFLSPDIRHGELAEMRGSKHGADDEEAVVVVSVVPTNEENAASRITTTAPPHALHFADAVVDIETCMMLQLRVITNGREEEEGDSSSLLGP